MKLQKLSAGLFLSLALCAGASGVMAQGLTKEESARLDGFETKINSADPAAARGLLADPVLLEKLSPLDPARASALKAKASAITDYEKLLDQSWAPDQERNLSAALALRLGSDGALVKVNLAPEPEKTLAWAAANKSYPADKTELLKKAVKNWDKIFDGCAFTPKYDHGTLQSWQVSTATGAYFMEVGRSDLIFKQSEAEMKAFWATLGLKERNDFLAAKAASVLSYFVNSSTRTDAGFQARVAGLPAFNYMDPSGKGRLDRYLAQMQATEAVKLKLPAAQLASLKDQPVEQQMYLLGSFFDNSKIRGAVDMRPGVDALRPSRPGETISAQNNALLSGMLKNSLVTEVKGTSPGDKVAAFYAGGAKLDVAIESCQGCYAKYEPSTGRIVMDSELIQQYMRVNNLNTEDLLKNKAKLAELSKYLSPVFTHEATHQMQHSWADKAGVYKPYTQEDEAEANAMEALLMAQKRDSDPKFKALFMRMDDTSSYARQRVELSKRFESDQKNFGEMVGQQYYPGVPSFEAASSQILAVVSGELERRNGLGAAELAELEKTGTTFSEARQMTAQELAGSVGGLNTSALEKIQGDLLHKNLYTDRYAGAQDWASSMLRGGAASKKSPVPAL